MNDILDHIAINMPVEFTRNERMIYMAGALRVGLMVETGAREKQEQRENNDE